MTVGDIKDRVMHQTNNDADDVEDYLPHLMDYINDGYDRLVYAYASEHLAEDGDYPSLVGDGDEPKLPEWTHAALADWATWLLYRNGNISKQQRGMAFRNAFEEVRMRIMSEGGKRGRIRNFFNIPR